MLQNIDNNACFLHIQQPGDELLLIFEQNYIP